MGVDAQMLLKVKGDYTDVQILTLARHTYECFGRDTVAIGYERERHCITRTEEFTQDGDSIFPTKNETLLEVHLHSRYYGKGYERGHLPDFIMLAEFFERLIPGVEVWYGGDSSGELAILFNKEARHALFQHFCEYGHTPYETYFDREKDGEMCDLCKIQLVRNGWGGNYKAWYCRGCGKTVEERDGKRKETTR
jgi:hypothetical protein